MKNLVMSLGLAAAIITGPSAFAGGDKKQEEQASTSSSKSAEKTRKFTGVILEHKVVNVFGSKQDADKAQKGEKQEPMNKTLVTLVKTDNGSERLIVDLGPVDKVPDIKNGETKLNAEGRLIQMGQRQLFVASKAKIGDKMINISREKS